MFKMNSCRQIQFYTVLRPKEQEVTKFPLLFITATISSNGTNASWQNFHPPMLFSKETLRSYAQSRGIVSVDDDALRVLSQDLEYRLKEVAQEASKFMLASHRTKLTIGDVNYALMSRSVEPLFGYDSQETLVFKGLPCNIYYIPSEDIDLEEYLERPLPKIPLRPYIQSHWLAIEGVQPPIQQNPMSLERPAVKLDALTSYQEEVELKQQHKHLLTKELNVYFDKILQTMETEPSIAVDCLKNETGIQQLVPYFIHHFKMLLRKKATDEPEVLTVLQMYDATLRNSFLFVDPYLHEVLPSILSCVVSTAGTDRIRKASAEIVKYIYETYGIKYATLSPRIVNFLTKAWLDDKKPEDSQYGALLCLSLLLPPAVKENVLKQSSEYKGTHRKVLDLLASIKKDTSHQEE